jgi:hypothetical protein
VWSELDGEIRSQERCSVVRYEFEPDDLEEAARACGWTPTSERVRAEA